jgi:hypothetical protein
MKPARFILYSETYDHLISTEHCLCILILDHNFPGPMIYYYLRNGLSRLNFPLWGYCHRSKRTSQDLYPLSRLIVLSSGRRSFWQSFQPFAVSHLWSCTCGIGQCAAELVMSFSFEQVTSQNYEHQRGSYANCNCATDFHISWSHLRVYSKHSHVHRHVYKDLSCCQHLLSF